MTGPGAGAEGGLGGHLPAGVARPRRRLRELLASDEILVLPGAADAMTARLIEQVGFESVYATGAGFANASFGLPDIGLVAFPEVREHVRRMAGAVSIPLVVDADTGYGGVLNVRRTVQELEWAGVAAVQIEDQMEPKRCGHFDGNTLVTTEQMVSRLAAAVEARTDPDLVIIARTDAYQSEGLAGAIERSKAYLDAGADALFIEAPTTHEDLKQIPAVLDAPLIVNMVEGGKTPLLPASELESLGFSVALYANTALRTAGFAIREAMRTLKEQGDTSSLIDRMLSWHDRQRLVELGGYQALEDRLLGVDQGANGGGRDADDQSTPKEWMSE